MKKKSNVLNKAIANIAHKESESSANSICNCFFYQPVLPDKVKKLRKKS